MTVTIEHNSVVDLSDVMRRAPMKVANAEHYLELYIRASVMTWVGRVDGKVACIWGLIPPSLLGDRATLWLQTTDLVEQHKFMFIRHSRIAMERMLAVYPIIVGLADPDFPENIRWLKWLGAQMHEPDMECGGIPFTIRAK